MVMMMMKTSALLLLLGLAVTSPAAAAGPGSCVGRCGEAFSRGRPCSCDFNCLQHDECCLDFLTTCTAAQSCQGRCGETFRRGRQCECDPQCIQFNTCCRDHQKHCGKMPVCQFPPPGCSTLQQLQDRWAQAAAGVSNSASEEWFTAPSGAAFTKPRPRPSTLQDIAQALGLVEGGPKGPGTGWTPGLFADANLCSDSPINGLTALSNGTILIFKGDLFWSVDAVSRSVSRPQSITDTMGVPSPIDTVFTRCNCHGHTYIIKGDLYWRLDGDMVMEPGYPRPLVSEFPGLTGSISAALAAPASGSRAETVYFFRGGDLMQSFTFPAGSTPACSKRPRSSSRTRATHQAVLLGGEINVKVSPMGFPTPVTAALSMPSPQRRDPYELYVFSGPLFFSVQISGDLPALTKPHPSAALASRSPVAVATNVAAHLPANSIRVWLRCP